METHLQNKQVSLDIAADKSSEDSLSFAGLLSIQDQIPKSPPTNSANHINKKDPEFEFGHTRSKPDSTATDAIKYFPADPSKQSQVITRSSDSEGSLPATRSRSKKSSDNTGGMRVSDKPNQKVRKKANKDSTAPSSWFGRKMFSSFISPCRECHAETPTVKAQAVPRQNLKLQY